jgi:hypothetical protein
MSHANDHGSLQSKTFTVNLSHQILDAVKSIFEPADVTFGVLTNCFIKYDHMLDKAYREVRENGVLRALM